MVGRPLLAVAAVTFAACAAPPAYREPGPPGVGASHPAPSLRVLVLGDFGDRTSRQARVTAAVLRWNEQHPIDFVLQPGDNLYDCGPDPRLPGADACRFAEDGATIAEGAPPPDDPRFAQNEAPLRALRRPGGEPIPSYLALGNHDIGAGHCPVPGMTRDAWMGRRACLEVAHRSPQWRIPGRHYVLDEGSVRFIVVDSNVAAGEYAGFTLAAEEAFVKEASAPCRDRTCFLVAHHPPALATAGPLDGPMEPGVVRMRRLVAAGGGRLAAVLAGHAHSLEHLALDDVDVLIAGAGARGARYRFDGAWPADARLRFALSAGGFGILEAWPGGWSFRFVDTRGRSLHCCEAKGRDRCRPIACPPEPDRGTLLGQDLGEVEQR